MEVSREDIVTGLRAIGLRAGATVLVHSSLSSFGRVAGATATEAANTVIEALLEVTGPRGTLMLPTFSGSATFGPDNPPVFDVRHTPCNTGRIPETFRARSDARRSLHPDHSIAAVGPRTDELLHDHELSPLPCGPDTPFGRLARSEDGYVLFLGADLACNTMFHHVEEIAGAPYHLQPGPTEATVIDYEGRRRTVSVWLHRWDTERNFPRPEPYFLAHDIERMGQIGSCTARLLQARPMVEYVVERLREDPWYLVAG